MYIYIYRYSFFLLRHHLYVTVFLHSLHCREQHWTWETSFWFRSHVFKKRMLVMTDSRGCTSTSDTIRQHPTASDISRETLWKERAWSPEHLLCAPRMRSKESSKDSPEKIPLGIRWVFEFFMVSICFNMGFFHNDSMLSIWESCAGHPNNTPSDTLWRCWHHRHILRDGLPLNPLLCTNGMAMEWQ